MGVSPSSKYKLGDVITEWFFYNTDKCSGKRGGVNSTSLRPWTERASGAKKGTARYCTPDHFPQIMRPREGILVRIGA